MAIYLDHNATTPIAPEVREAMRPYLDELFGNPSSAHEYGRVAFEGAERARAEVAALIGCEADNLAIKGVALARLGDGDHIITSENVPYIVGLGAACALAARRLRAGVPDDVRRLRDRLHAQLRSAVPGLALNGHPEQRLPNTLNVSFPGCDGEALLAGAPSVVAATGSACHPGRTEPSDVLTAMGLDAERALAAVRLSLGHDTTAADVDAAAAALAAGAAAATPTLSARHAP